MMNKIWKIKSSVQTSKIKEVINILLKNRGLVAKKEINDFLNPQDPYTIEPKAIGISKEELNKAIKRIKKAIDNKENIVIYGDYDADGICATAIIWETLHFLKANVLPFIPNREDLGYGLKKEGIDDIINKSGKKPDIIITVDNGIVAHSGVSYANKLGIDIILTDHHQKKIKNLKFKIKNYDLPKAHAIIWSDKVCGAGVAWFLAKEIYHKFHDNLQGFKASNALELACIGTITDLMPVMAINRSIIKFGLKELKKSKRTGLQAICKESNINQEEIDVYEIGYIIGPRLNAMGRLEDALESLRLLCTKNLDKANNLAAKLGLTNRERQQLTQVTYEHAFESSKSIRQSADQSSKLIFLAHESYNQGIIGLVAGKLADEYYRPAIVIAKGKIFSKASVRSINGFNIIEALRNFEDLYEDLGGHPMAAGFTIKTEKIDKLHDKLQKYFSKNLSDDLLQPKINIDLEIDLKNVDLALEKSLQALNPFGISNPRPTFCSRNIKVIDNRFVGRNSQHLKLKLQSQDNQSVIFDAIGFNLSKTIKPISRLELIDICFNMDINEWNGNKNLQLIIRDIKKIN